MNDRRPVGGEAGDGDKLPWLEPYREPGAVRPRLRAVAAAPAGPSKPAARRRRAIGSSVGASLGLFAAAALALGGYWYGRQSLPSQASGPSAIVTPLPQAGGERPVLTYPTIEDSPTVGAAARTPPNPAAAAPPSAKPAKAIRRASPARAGRASVGGRAAPDGKPPPPPTAAPPAPKPRATIALPAIAAPSVAAAAPRAVYAAPPKPAGKPGQVILLGYYASPRFADLARRRVVSRYPYLGGLPVQVAAISLGRGRGAMYALRLVGRSKSEARALCRNLKTIGYGCTVQ